MSTQTRTKFSAVLIGVLAALSVGQASAAVHTGHILLRVVLPIRSTPYAIGRMTQRTPRIASVNRF